MKKVLSIVLIVTMLFSILTIVPAAADTTTSYTEISTEAQLKNMKPDGNYILTQDITLEETWTKSIDLNGTFDGNGKTISGELTQPLFGKVAAGAEVKDLTLKDVTLNGSGRANVLATTNYGLISNITVKAATMTSTNDGALVYENYGTISNVTLDEKTSVKVTTNRAAGVVNYNRVSGVVRFCKNYANITAGWHVAGFVSDNRGSVENCINYGDMTATTQRAAGISATNYENSMILNCVNYGAILSQGNKMVSGIGASEKDYFTVANCYNAGTVTTQVSDSSAIGSISALNNTNKAAGCRIVNCYTLGGRLSVGGAAYADTADTNDSSRTYFNGTVVADASVAYAKLGDAFTYDANNAKYPIDLNYNATIGSVSFTVDDSYGYTKVTNADELWNALNDSAKCYLANDITITTWAALSNTFKGILVGNGHTITFKVDSPFFANNIDASAIIKDLTIDGLTRTNVNWNGFAQGNFYGWMDNVHFTKLNLTGTGNNVAMFNDVCGIISNSTVRGDITCETEDGNINRCATFATRAKVNSKFLGCTNYANITSVYRVGGFAGESEGAYFGSCLNYGNITAVRSLVGGFVGLLTSTNATTFSNCGNYGTVTSRRKDNSIVSGIAPAESSTSGKMNVWNCFNAGKLVTAGDQKIGTMSGYQGSGSTFSNCYAVEGMLFRITDGTDTNGLITGEIITTPYTGGFNATNCVNGTEVTKAEFASAEMLAKLGGAFALNTGTDKVEHPIIIATSLATATATPVDYDYKLVGVQDDTTGSNKFNIRFVGILNDGENYSEVGVSIKAYVGEYDGIIDTTDKNFGTVYTNEVYKTILANKDGVQTAITAEELGGDYLYALTVTNVPANETIIFAVTAIAKDMEGAVSTGATHYVTYKNGIFDSETTVEPTVYGSAIKVMSFNLHSGNEKSQTVENGDTTNATISNRMTGVVNMVIGEGIDVFGVQECKYSSSILERSSTWYYNLNNNLKNVYSNVGTANSDHKEGGYIFYRTDKFDCINSGTFWLAAGAPTTSKKTEGIDADRICTWALLKVKNTNDYFLFMDTHLTAASAEDRESFAEYHQMDSATSDDITNYQAQVIVGQIGTILDGNGMSSNCPVILVGDMNAHPDSKTLATLKDENTANLKDACDVAWLAENSNVNPNLSTSPGYNYVEDASAYETGHRIDYILVGGSVEVANYEMIHTSTNLSPYTAKDGSGYLSDHNAIIAQIKIVVDVNSEG